jgi:sulfofructose kinase
VDCAAVTFSSEARPFHSTIVVDSSAGSRTIFSYDRGVTFPRKEDLNPEWVTQSRVVFVDHHAADFGLHVARTAHQSGVPVVADFENPDMPGLKELAGLVDHLIVNIDFAQKFTGQTNLDGIFSGLCSPQRTACVVTAGAQGCRYTAGGGEIEHFPAFQVRVVDTTGCGDVFHGAYAAAIARGESVAQAVAIASATAGIKASFPGGRAGIPNLETTQRFLGEHPAGG